MSEFDDRERHLLVVCIERYESDIAAACEEDQGVPQGQPGTLGHAMQLELADLRQKVSATASPDSRTGRRA